MYSNMEDKTKLVIYQPTFSAEEVICFNKIIENHKNNFTNIHIQHNTSKLWDEDGHYTSIKIVLDEELVSIEKRSVPYADWDMTSPSDMCEVYSDGLFFIEKFGIVAEPKVSKFTDNLIQDLITHLIKRSLSGIDKENKTHSLADIVNNELT